MATRKVGKYTRADGTKVRAHVRSQRKTTNRRASADPAKRKAHLMEMRRLGRELRTNKKLSSEQRRKLQRTATFHGVKAGKIKMI